MHVSPGRTESRRSCHDWYVATQHVDELRKLVDGILSQDGADAGHARILPHLEHGAVPLVERLEGPAALLRVLDHRAELEHLEGLAVQPAPQLTEEHWPP